MHTTAVLLDAPGKIGLEEIDLTPPKSGDVVVRIRHSGISTGTEKLFYSGKMPPFPGMGYPLVPGYESFGEIVEAGIDTGFRVGEHVFVPGADCYGEIKGLFGGASRIVVTSGDRVVRVDGGLGATGALLALAATARHAVAGLDHDLPDLIVGHGVLGRLIARITLAAGGTAPMVWDLDADRRAGAEGYSTSHPDDDPRRNYQTIFDVSGDSGILNSLIGRMAKGGEIVLAGFYSDPLSFAFAPAFMKEARMRVAAEWNRDDMLATRLLVEEGLLSLDGLITHRSPAADAAGAYETAFGDPSCLKMILDWEGTA